MARPATLLAVVWVALIALWVFAADAAFAQTGGQDEFSLSDLVPVGSAVLGGALTAGATMGVARKTLSLNASRPPRP
jgi:hypothetical protein